MAYNTGFIAESEIHTVAESPNLDVLQSDGAPKHPKRPRNHSPTLFGSPDLNLLPHSVGLPPSMEMKKHIVSTCRAIVKLELTLSNLDAKSNALEQHRLNGTFPKDLLLPKKKSLFEDEQSKVDEILQKASIALLMQRIAEISRKKSETLARKGSLESDFVKSLESSRDSQLMMIPPEDHNSISIVKKRFASNLDNFYSQLAISRENAFFKAKRVAEKEAKKKNTATAMDIAPDVRVIDVLDQRLKQLGLIGRKSRTPSSTSDKSRSRSSSRGSRSGNSVSTSSRSPSRSSSRGSRGLPRRCSSKKRVKFNSRIQVHHQSPKNGGPTTPLNPRGKGRGRGRGSR